MTRHLATLRAAKFKGHFSEPLQDYILDRRWAATHHHLVVELHPRLGAPRRQVWLRIARDLHSVTLPAAICRGRTRLFRRCLVVQSSGGPRNLTMSQGPFIGGPTDASTLTTLLQRLSHSYSRRLPALG